MNTVDAGKFEVNLKSGTRLVVIKLGIRTEILRLIARKQLEYRNISSKNLVPVELRAKLNEVADALNAAKELKVDDGDAAALAEKAKKIDELQAQVNELYIESIDTVDKNKLEYYESTFMGMIDLTDDAITEILAVLLSVRDEKGNITRQITKEELLYGDEFAEDADELLSLVEGAMDYIITALKKIQVVSQMVTDLVKQG